MKKHYTMKALLFLGIIVFTFQKTKAQIRIVEVNPATETVKLHNYGPTTVNVAGYWFCNLFAYTQVSDGTIISGSTNLAAGADLEVVMAANLNDIASDLGLYQSPSFGSSTAMLDFTQWGSGGNGREGVAVTKGIWTAGTFVNAAPPYAYTGNGSQNGFQFWDTLLGINDFNSNLGIHLYPNPTSSLLNVELNASEANLTFQVFDILGKQVFKRMGNSENLSKIHVSNFENGLYFIKISAGDKSETKRFIKK